MAGLDRVPLAVIPARSGSRGLPDKNVLDLCGRPVLCYTVDAALKSGAFERVVVSTDSERYGEIAEAAGAEVAYRGEELSGPEATTFMVLENLIGRLAERPWAFGLLQPTSPLRTASQTREAVDVFLERSGDFDFLASVEPAEHPSFLVAPLDDRGGLGNLNADFSSYRRQSFAEYSPNGAIFLAKTDAYLEQGHFFGERSLAYVMDRESSVDIDDIVDFRLAETCMRARAGGQR